MATKKKPLCWEQQWNFVRGIGGKPSRISLAPWPSFWRLWASQSPAHASICCVFLHEAGLSPPHEDGPFTSHVSKQRVRYLVIKIYTKRTLAFSSFSLAFGLAFQRDVDGRTHFHHAAAFWHLVSCLGFLVFIFRLWLFRGLTSAVESHMHRFGSTTSSHGRRRP